MVVKMIILIWLTYPAMIIHDGYAVTAPVAWCFSANTFIFSQKIEAVRIYCSFHSFVSGILCFLDLLTQTIQLIITIFYAKTTMVLNNAWG